MSALIEEEVVERHGGKFIYFVGQGLRGLRRQRSKLQEFDGRGVFGLPGGLVASGERATEVDLHGDPHLPAWSYAESKTGVCLTLSRKDPHHRPGAETEDSLEGPFVDVAWLSRIAGMRMEPNASKLFRPSTDGNLLFEELGDCDILEFYRNRRADLADEADVFNVKQVVFSSNSKAADFGGSLVPQMQ